MMIFLWALSTFFFLFFFFLIFTKVSITNSNISPILQAGELIGSPSITGGWWESCDWIQKPMPFLILIVPPLYPPHPPLASEVHVTLSSRILQGENLKGLFWRRGRPGRYVEFMFLGWCKCPVFCRRSRMVTTNPYLGAQLKLCPLPCRSTTHSQPDTPKLPP